jgi:hypothetical protein
MDFNTEIIIIMFCPFVVVMLFQLSSLLNQSILSIGLRLIEIEDFSGLSNMSEERIRMIPLKNDQVKFKVLAENQKEEIGYVIFDQKSSKIIEHLNIEIDNEKISEFRKMMFSRLTLIPIEKLRISEDGDTFNEIELDQAGKEVIISSITFDNHDYDNPPLETSVKFKKMF